MYDIMKLVSIEEVFW